MKVKTYWPFGILLIILIGIVLITATIIISTKQSIAPDNAYDSKKVFLESRINDFIEIQNKFETYLLPFIFKDLNFQNGIRILSPLLARAPRIDIKDENVFELINNKSLYLVFSKVKENSPFKIKNITLELIPPSDKNKQIKESIIIDFHQNSELIYESSILNLIDKGQYKGIIRIVLQNKENESSTIFYTHYFMLNDK